MKQLVIFDTHSSHSALAKSHIWRCLRLIEHLSHLYGLWQNKGALERGHVIKPTRTALYSDLPCHHILSRQSVQHISTVICVTTRDWMEIGSQFVNKALADIVALPPETE